VDSKRYARLARELISAFGGPVSVAECCRRARSRLAEFMNEMTAASMKGAVIPNLGMVAKPDRPVGELAGSGGRGGAS